jgi:hypothetical protein
MHTGTLLEHTQAVWNTLGTFWALWDTLGHFGTLWDTFGHSHSVRGAQGGLKYPKSMYM